MTFPGPSPSAPHFECGVLNFVFGEMWSRPGLDQRAHRWLTLVGVAEGEPPAEASQPPKTVATYVPDPGRETDEGGPLGRMDRPGLFCSRTIAVPSWRRMSIS